MNRLVAVGVSLAVACTGATPPGTPPLPHEAASLGWAPSLVVPPSQLVGWIGVTTAPGHDHAGPGWIAVDRDAVAVLPADRIEIAPDVEVLAVPATGDPVRLRSGPVRTIRYGCDGGTLEVQPFERGGGLPLGAVWLIPTPLPERWQPAPIQVRAIERSTERRRWQIGSLEVVTTRLDEHHAELAIRAGDRTLHVVPVAAAHTTGADDGPLDLAADHRPGVPIPVAAFAIAPDGPALIILAHPGFEGMTLAPLLVSAERAEEVDAMRLYLYHCAF